MPNENEIVCMNTSLEIYRIYGIFPAKHTELNPGIKFYLKFIGLALISSLPLIGSVSHLIKTLKDHENNHLELDYTYVVSLASGYCLVGCFYFKVKSAIEMYLFFSDFEEFGEPPDFQEYNTLFDKLTKIHYVYLQTAIALIILLSNIFKGKTCEMENSKLNLTEVCGLFSNIWLPFDINYFPVWHIYLAIQLFGVEYIYMLCGLLAWIVVETVQHIIVRIKHVKYVFLEAIREKDSRLRREKFNFAIRYHVAVLGLEDKLNDCLGIFMLNHLVVSAAVLGCGIYAFSHASSLSTIFVCVGWFIGLMMDCFSGQRLQDESLAVGEAIYNSNWDDIDDVDMKKELVIVIMRCRRPMKLKAASFGTMDRATFVSVLKATYSYLTLLRQTNQRSHS